MEVPFLDLKAPYLELKEEKNSMQSIKVFEILLEVFKYDII